MKSLPKSLKKSDTKTQLLFSSCFNFLYPIGKGGFGRVWKVEMHKTKQLFAMKEMDKLRVISKRSVHSVMNERKILENLKHPFIVNMQFAFQDRDTLFLVMDLMTGGDLRYHMNRQRFFLESQVRFFSACIITGLEYIHNNKIIHRDIKPENLVFDSKGYLRITDFGIARTWKLDNFNDTSGTPGYMAPEVMCRQNHTYAADYFALGVLLYELMMGKRPYQGKDRKELRDQILSKQVQIKNYEVPPGWSLEAANFINLLIQRKTEKRLGGEEISEDNCLSSSDKRNKCQNRVITVKNHPWMAGFNWDSLYIGAMPSPFRPKAEDNFDPRGMGVWNDSINPNVQCENIERLFNDYYYDINKLIKR
ncbi:hypothetical protein SteCoe_20092 [Stentor coeruleus]|uniref:non-specific serine/threonine protein kinase n=1 Tax=Stentor coeruleus TaxID=5963 RepID=A0A1R2BSJ3_9CILI|nr:hypothetical protein SteCoe_20092 [Stentor coeruleus]